MPAQTSMPRRRLTRDGLEVAQIGCGLWAQGGHWGPVDDAASLSAIDAALGEGVDFFDTADVYGDGHSERLLGRAMQGRRHRFVVGTKIGWRGYDAERHRSAYDTVEKLIEGVESNLRRLDTEYIDLIQCHVFYEEPNTPVFIEGFRRLKQQGKVRAWGVSTGDLAHVRRFNASGDCGTLQIDYSILNRDSEREVLPYCQEHGIGVIVRGPLAMGILTGKFNPGSTFKGDDFRRAWKEDPAQGAQYRADLQTVDRLRAAVPGRSLAELALLFPLAHPAVTTVIPGARNEHQARQNCSVRAAAPLSPRDVAAIDTVVAPGGGRKIWPA